MAATSSKTRLRCPACGLLYYPGDKTTIHKKKLLLVEGVDAHRFMIFACNAYQRREEIQVIDFGGTDELGMGLKTIKNTPGFDDVESLVIARDVEQSRSTAIDNVRTALEKVELPVPEQPFEFHDTKTPKTAFMLFPGPNVRDIGTLEDLCLATIKSDPLLECVQKYTECVIKKGEKRQREHKKKLHCYLAGKDEFEGMKIGEAAKAGAWDWEDKALAPFKEIIQAM